MADEAIAEKAGDPGVDSVSGFVGGFDLDAGVFKQLNAAETYYYFATHHPWIGSAVTMIAQALAADGYDIIAPGVDKDQDEVDADPRVQAIRLMLETINENQGLTELVEECSLDYDICGRFFCLKLRLPGNKKCVGLERVDPRTIAPKLSGDGKKIVSFVQKTRVNGVMVTTKYKPEDVVYVARPGGADLMGGPSLLDELDLTLAVDFAARKHNAAFFRNGARAGDVFVNDQLSKDQAEAAKKLVESQHGGTDNAYRPMMLSGKWQVFRAEAGKNDEEFEKGQDRALTEVCAVFHIPEGKLKTTDGALGQAGKEADDQTFHEECVSPRARRIYRAFTRELLLKEWGIADLAIVPKAKYQFRLSAVPEAAQMLAAGATVNEARSVWGAPKSAFKGADLDAPMVPTTSEVYQDPVDPLELAKAHAPVMPPGGGAPPKPGDPAPTNAPAPKPKPAAKKAGRFGWREAIDG